MRDLYYGKTVILNKNGNNDAIRVCVKDDEKMEAAGFIKTVRDEWYMCRRVSDHITFNFTVRNEDDWSIDVLDEYILQPYDYQNMLEENPKYVPARVVRHNVDDIMLELISAGIIGNWEIGDYI